MKTRRDLAEHLGVSTTLLAQWKNEGCPIPKRGPYDEHVPAITEWIAQNTESDVSVEDDAEFSEARRQEMVGRARERLAKAEMAQLDLAVKRGELIQVEDAIEKFGRLFVDVKNECLAMPQKLAHLCNPADPANAKNVIKREVRTIWERAQARALKREAEIRKGK